MKWGLVLIASVTGCTLPASKVTHDGGTPLREACEHADTPAERATACLSLAGYLEEGRFGLRRDPDRAMALRMTAVDTLEASCDLGEVADCTRAALAIGSSIGTGGGEPASALAEPAMWMERYAQDGCAGGDATGCALLGSMYESGRMLERDPARAEVYFDKACSGGDRRSCLRLAERARGKDAARLYERACDAGSGFGCAAAGRRHDKSAGVYFARGCALGDPASCVLGVELHQHDDRRTAARFAFAGCQQGIPDACLLLGEIYERGAGVPRNESAALEAYRKACEAGLREGCDAVRAARGRSLVRNNLTPDSASSVGRD